MSSSLITNIFTGQTRRVRMDSDLAAPWCLDLPRKEFVKWKIFSLMQKIMTDCYRFSSKIKDEDKEMSLFDSIVYKTAQYGLLSRIALSIANFRREYIVYDHGIIRVATPAEKKDIDKDYKSGNVGAHGIIIDFSEYALGRLLAHYFHQIYTVEAANNNSIALGGSLQYKVAGFRAKIGLSESLTPEIKSQAVEVCQYAKDGKPIVIDKDDSLEQSDASKNVNVAESSKNRIYGELAAALGCSVSYIIGDGDTTNGSGDSLERLDGRNEDMIHNFWITIFNPIVSTLLKEKLNFVSQKWQIIKNNTGTIMVLEGIKSIPDDIKASVIAKLIGDNKPNPKDELEQQILKQLQAQPDDTIEEEEETLIKE